MTVRLHLGECLEFMRSLPDGSVDAVITDPPFSMAGGISHGRTSLVDEQFFLHWWRNVCDHLERVCKPTGEGFVWCDWRTAPTMAKGFSVDQTRTWRMAQMLYHYREMTGMGQPFRNSVDQIAYLRGPKSQGDRIPNTTENWISRYWYYGKHEFHPAEKDPEICKKLLAWCSDEGDTILDPFMGSGPVGIACILTGRNFIGAEIDEKYFAIAEKRIRESQMQPALMALD